MRSSSLALAAALGLALVGTVVTASAGDSSAPTKQEKEKWGDHMGDLPFVIGYAKGMKQVENTGKPPMYFFTATW
jgi:hypothetical protein